MILKQAPVVAVDGPSGVGKGTLCTFLAQHLKWHILDSGAIYRVLALSALKNNIALDNETRLALHALNLPLEFKTSNHGVEVLLANDNVSQIIRSQEIGEMASKVAALPEVRSALLQRQRDFRRLPGLIADGRDMGTVVFCDAQVKIFLDASAQARAERRMKQLQKKGICVKFGEIFQEIVERDNRDRNRTVAPLKPAPDALVIDSTNITIEDVFNQALVFVKRKLKSDIDF